MKKTYRAPQTDAEPLGMEWAILQASGNFGKDDYGNWIDDEWGN